MLCCVLLVYVGCFQIQLWTFSLGGIIALVNTIHEVWNLVPLCLMWTVWCESNWRIFEDAEHSNTKLIELFFGLLFDKARVWGLTLIHSLADFVVSLSFSCIPNSVIV